MLGTIGQDADAAVVRHQALLRAAQETAGDLPKRVYAKRPQCLPEWLNHDDPWLLPPSPACRALLARLTYGCGLRLMEILPAAHHDIDLNQRRGSCAAARRAEGTASSTCPLWDRPVLPRRSSVWALGG